MSMILHDWDDAARRDGSSQTSQPPARAGARVVALELVVPGGDEPHMAKMIDLTMLGMLTGRERTEAEMRTLFEAAGLRFDGSVARPRR